MQSWQIPWKKLKYIYVTLICIRKFQDRFPELSVVPDWKASSSQFCISSSWLIWQRSVEIILLFCQVKCWYWKYWNSQQDIWLLWSILLQLLNRHSWAGCGLKIRMLIPRFFPSWLQWWAEKWCLKACEVCARSAPQWGALLCWSVLAVLCCVFWQIAAKTWAWMLLSVEK